MDGISIEMENIEYGGAGADMDIERDLNTGLDGQVFVPEHVHIELMLNRHNNNFGRRLLGFDGNRDMIRMIMQERKKMVV